MTFKWKKSYIFIAILCMISIFTGVLGGVTYYKLKSTDILRHSEHIDTDDKINIIIAGIDSMENFADTLILATIDTPAKEITLTSIPSDTLVNVQNSTQKIGSVWSIGGGEMLKEHTASLTKKNIHNFVAFDFATLEKTFDILGKVEFDIPFDMYYTDTKQGLTIDFKKGTKSLNGAECVKLLRYKPTDEASRREIQNAFLKSFISQMSTDDVASKLPSLLKEIIKHVSTDFSKYSIERYVQIVKTLNGKAEVITKTLTGNYQTINDISYFVAE